MNILEWMNIKRNNYFMLKKYENEWIIWDEQIRKWMNILRRMNKYENKWIFWDEKNMEMNEYYRLNNYENEWIF